MEEIKKRCEVWARLKGRAVPAEQADEVVSVVVSDVALLVGEVERLHAELVAARLRVANLVAGIRAALNAAEDGEPDPLVFLRDEFAELFGSPGDSGSGGGTDVW